MVQWALLVHQGQRVQWVLWEFQVQLDLLDLLDLPVQLVLSGVQ